jgi:putative flavoprotein involved in K+ transport
MPRNDPPRNARQKDAGRRPRAGGASASVTETLVIGAGQTGLTTGYYLSKAGQDPVILDAQERVGDAWRKRWDSLVLFTPNRFNGLPGRRFPGARDHFPTKDEMADYLEGYASAMGLDVRLRTRVTRVSRRSGAFFVETDRGDWRARNVIVAMADLQAPWTPDFAGQLDGRIRQFHSHDFVSADGLDEGPVLIVGAGNSGADIAMDVCRSHDTILAGTPAGAVPFRIEPWIARNVLIAIVRFAALHVLTRRHPIGKRLIPRVETKGKPLVRVKPSDLEAATRRVGRITGVEHGKPVTEAGEALDVRTVIWCTGYRPDWSWIAAGARDHLGRPLQQRGEVVDVPGLYMVGQEFLFAAASATVTGHQRDVRHVVRRLVRRSRSSVIAQPVAVRGSAS